MCVIDQLNEDDDDDVVDACADDGPEPEVPAVQLMVDRPPPRAELADLEGTDENPQRTRDGEQQLLQVPVSAISQTTAAALASSLLEKLASLRHGRSSVHDERHKQQKMIENRAKKALRTVRIASVRSRQRAVFLLTPYVSTTTFVFPHVTRMS